MSRESVEWDEDKNESNLAKHGIDFLAAVAVFDDENRLEAIDDRCEYGEIRYQVLGRVHGLILFVVYTSRGNVRRIISARRANRRERQRYQALGS